jgi:hypothetical protein
MGFLKRQWNRLCEWWSSLWDRPYTVEMVEELPDRLVPKILYVAGENGHLWFAAMVCPCGCGETLQLGLLKDARPRWSVSMDNDILPTLQPSVWRQVACRSHFFLTRGRIVWCEAGSHR